ncbi:MAG: hypothetical protein NTX64_06400 [Elusimicrobia bacterium]|nr:hypothetical protein [Elusimicrobiota bacterium]
MRSSLLSATTLLFVPVFLAAQGEAPKGPWSFTAGAAVKESYDSNVLLQAKGDQARRKAWVTAVAPGLGAAYSAGPEFKAAGSYGADVVRYHEQSSENNVTHRGALTLSGKSGDTAWESPNSLTWIDGSKDGPAFTGGGAIPAVGGIPIRDRRAALVYRDSIKLTQTMGRWFARPVFTSYVHDFRTAQYTASGAHAGYENYVSRYEVNGGLDAGFAVREKTWAVLGYRVGRQHQGLLLGADSPYSNTYHRFLAGAEGEPTSWLKVNVLAGPELRRAYAGAPAGFQRNRTRWYYDASLTLTPAAADSVAASARRYEQPAFSSQSAYEDVTYALTWQHKFCDRLAASAGFKVYAGLWQPPVQRRDWIYTPSLSLSGSLDKHLSADLAYSYDWVSSAVANADNREFRRHMASAGVKYAF